MIVERRMTMEVMRVLRTMPAIIVVVASVVASLLICLEMVNALVPSMEMNRG